MKYLLPFVVFLTGILLPFAVTTSSNADLLDLHKKPLLRSVRFVDDQHGWISGYRGVFYTSDAGRSWRRQPATVGSSTPREGQLVVQNTGLIVWADENSCMVRTEKGLATGRMNQSDWVVVTLPDLHKAWFVGFLNQQRGWALIFATPGTLLYGTTNGGLEWRRESKTFEALHGLFAVSQSNIWAVGSEGKALNTTDGGQAWNEVVINSARRKVFPTRAQ